MLLSKTVKVNWTNATKRYYKEKGYTYTKNNEEFEVRIEDLADRSNVKVEVLCDCPDCKNNHKKLIRWADYLKNTRKYNGKYYCRYCVKYLFGEEKRMNTILKNSISFEQWCIDNNRQDILDRWDYELNGKLPSEVSYCSNQKYFFKCSLGIHKSQLKNINSFVSRKTTNIKCNYCNSFAQWGIDNIGENFLEKYWDHEKNEGVDPWELDYSSNKKAWMKCQEKDYHESYYIALNNFVSGKRCPYCSHSSGKINLLDSMGIYIINKFGKEFLNSIWSEKNKKSAFEYSPKTNKKVWWKCPDGEHDDYKREISSSNNYDFRCPNCSNERDESLLQEKVRLYLESLGYNVFHEYNCSIVPMNPKTKRLLPFDNEVRELNLIVEVHGRQHYELLGDSNLWLDGLSQEEYLHYQRLKDRYKKFVSKSRGYNYLEIPYKTNNKKETWKKLINNKIQEILITMR